ncbi:MAG: acyltransferase family protein [Acidimicrobiales bacterium]
MTATTSAASREDVASPTFQVPTAVAGRHLPALDGLRALAILSVFAYHLGFGWASGGFLGVDLFFVLSGFLITSLIVEERSQTGRIRLGGFWVRRAKRLLPALLLMLVVLSIFVAIDPGPTNPTQLRGDALATILYFANWHMILAQQSYFAQLDAVSPLQHTWSLAIEEQFYLIWPLLLAALFAWATARSRLRSAFGKETWRKAGLTVTVIGALVSAGWMTYLWHSGADINRIYFGTDSRAFDLLIGAAAAMVACSRPQPTARTRKVLHAVSPICLIALVIFWGLAGVAGGTQSGGTPRGFMWNGGFLLCSVLAAILISDVRQLEAGPLGKLLSIRPLRWIGKISYGLYLWHWPVIVELNSARTGLNGLALDAFQVAVAFAISTVSFYLVEQPIRRSRFNGFPGPARAALVPIGMGITAVVVLMATMSAGASPSEKVVVSADAPGAGHLAIEHATQKPIVLPAGIPSRSHPLNVMLLGDSVIDTEAPAIQAAFDSTGEAVVENNSFPGWGLTTDPGWSQTLPALIRQNHPQIVVAMWSWDNACLVGPVPEESCSLTPAQYKADFERFIETVLAPGDGVDGLVFQEFPQYGVTFSPSNVEELTKGKDAWNSLAASMPALFPGRVMYLPVASAVELNGQFSDWLPPENDPQAPRSSWVRVRMIDGVHFCPAGAARYAAAVLSDLTILFHLPAPSSDWWEGSWTNNKALYNTPPGNCPDDHP